MQEIFKPIKNYPNYQASNLGRVYSKYTKRILKPTITKCGYHVVRLYKNGKVKGILIHCLVWDCFNNKPRNGKQNQIDHVDGVKANNKINNLQLLTNRQNVSKGFIQNGKKTSKYTGVHWDKYNNKWKAQITINSKVKNLGRFTDEYDAHLTYKKALDKIKE